MSSSVQPAVVDEEGRGPGMREELAGLYRAAGEPSLDALVSAAAGEGRAVSRTTLHNLLRGTAARPRWETVEAFVVACAAYARTRKPRIRIPEGEADLAVWRARHQGPPVDSPAAALARHFAEPGGLPHYIPAGLDRAALDQPRQVRDLPRSGGRTEGPRPWERALAEHPRIVLLADAGLGKSWLLRTHARRVSREALDRLRDGTPPAEVPLAVVLHCGEVAARPEAALGPAVAARLMERGILPGSDRAYLVDALTGGRILLLLDAYDELPDHTTRSHLHTLLATAPPTLRCVVSTRQAGYPGPPGPDWRELLLDPFGEAESAAVIRVWPLTPAARASLGARIDAPGLGGLARVPLLLALLCALAEEVPPGGGAPDLPASKGELYERMLRRFLVHEHRPPAAEDTEADRLIDVLAPLAYYFAGRADGWQDVMPREAVLRAIRSAGAPFTELGRDAASVLRTLSVEAGILQPLGDPSGGRVQPYLFAHRSFAEYLAARHLASLPEEEILEVVETNLLDDDRWRDTLAMLGRLVLTREGREPFERLLWHLLGREAAVYHFGVLHAVRMIGDLGERTMDFERPLQALLLRRFWTEVMRGPELALDAVGSCRALPDELVDLLVEALVRKMDTYAYTAPALAHHPQASVTAFLVRAVTEGRSPFDVGRAVAALAHRPGAEALRGLLAAFRDVHWPDYTGELSVPHQQAVRALRARRDPEALGALLWAAGAPGPPEPGGHGVAARRLRTGALEVLGGYPDAAATEALLAGAEDPDPQVRAAALRELAGRAVAHSLGTDVRPAAPGSASA
ncbi:NACHT domain-containing NTPase [Streptomyces sp. NBC_00091]|uniref:NACHT domain-containing protein n=1 Tax=Streptomyces sp. NBC_00091 TaxID=2975648 RepID=UPI002255DB0D|nr:hypothetical protein [Streptomyces sp. NBC_00091]MCX5377736.1 hypothetical protein [Streptomyces sp. NBC_00091]